MKLRLTNSDLLIAVHMAEDLTKRQYEILSYLVDFKTINKRMPTLREVAEHFTTLWNREKPLHHQGINDIYNKLIAKGYMTKENGKPVIQKGLNYDISKFSSKIRELKSLVDEGALTLEEYNNAKQRLIDRL